MFERDPEDAAPGLRLSTTTAEAVYESLGGPIYGLIPTVGLTLQEPSLSGVQSITVRYVLDGSPPYRADAVVITETAEDFGVDEQGIPFHIAGRLESFISNWAQGRQVAVAPIVVRSDSSIRGGGDSLVGTEVDAGDFWAVGARVSDRHVIALGHRSVTFVGLATVHPQPIPPV